MLKKIKLNKEEILQAIITAVVTLIVGAIAVTIFDIYVAIYSGITAGLSVTVGKEYGDSLVMEYSWKWNDVIPGVLGAVAGIIFCVIFYCIVAL